MNTTPVKHLIVTPHVMPQLLLPLVALIALCAGELRCILDMRAHVFIEVRFLIEALLAMVTKVIAHLGMH